MKRFINQNVRFFDDKETQRKQYLTKKKTALR
jgi:hypothetical protein